MFVGMYMCLNVFMRVVQVCSLSFLFLKYVNNQNLSSKGYQRLYYAVYQETSPFIMCDLVSLLIFKILIGFTKMFAEKLKL